MSSPAVELTVLLSWQEDAGGSLPACIITLYAVLGTQVLMNSVNIIVSHSWHDMPSTILQALST
jgi:hypothetical protein